MANLFGMGGGGIEVYLTVSPSGGLELIELDKNGNIKSYAQSPLDYNEAQREVANYEDFKRAVEELFTTRNINPAQASVHLSIPTVWFGAKEGLPLLLDENAIGNIVLGELEQTYIFKRKDPLPFWFDNLVSHNSDSRSIFYTAVQSEAIETIRSILAEMGAALVSVECSLFATLKGLYLTGIAREQMATDSAWSLMIINNSGFQILDMQSNRILGYYEEPLPLKTYEGDEIYGAIENAAQIAFMSTASSSLVVVSETDLVSAQVLSEKLQFAGQIINVEDNKFRMEPLMDLPLNILAEDQIKVSLHALGHQCNAAGILPVDVNFIAGNGSSPAQAAFIETPFGKLTPGKAIAIVLIVGALLLVPLLLASFLFGRQAESLQAQNEELNTKITQLEEQLNAANGTGGNSFNAIDEIERTLKNNRTKIMAYAALGESIPKNIYLTYFLTGEDGKINIKGCAEAVEDVYVFFKNLKDSLVDSNLRISKLDMKSGSLDKIVNSTVSTVDDAPYVFEITNMSEEELKAFKDSLLKQDKQDENNENGANNDPNAPQQQAEVQQ